MEAAAAPSREAPDWGEWKMTTEPAVLLGAGTLSVIYWVFLCYRFVKRLFVADMTFLHPISDRVE